jgi:phage gp29-like protein
MPKIKKKNTTIRNRNDKKITSVNNPSSLAVIDAVPVQNPRNIYSLYTNEFSNLTADNIKYYMECARRGLNFWKSLLFEEIRRKDVHIGGVCQTRKLSIASKNWKINCESDIIKNFVYENIKRINLINLMTDIIEAQIQGVSIFEITLDYSKGKWMLNDVCIIPNHLVVFDDINNEYKFLDITKTDGNMLRTIGYSSLEARVDLSRLPMINISNEKILEVHSLDGNAQNGFSNGCIDSLIWAYFFKSYGIKDYAVYLERFAMPPIIGTYDPFNTDSTTKNNLNNAVKNFGNLFYATFPNTCEIKTPFDANSASNDVYKTFIEYWNEQASIRVIGQTLTTKIGSSGSYASAKVHDTVRKDILAADMLLVKNVMTELIQRIVKLNFCTTETEIEFSFIEERDIDYLKTTSEVYKNLNELGYKIDSKEIKSAFGVNTIS